jgi:CRISPR/Cas system CMR subunit Cmr4 (Cas7 group RAMP superfamily)
MTTITTLKLVLEAQSPMAIYSGAREVGFDNELARDANGLPYIPATSFAGVWRHLVEQEYGVALARDWFGTSDNSANERVNSQISISDGKVHDSKNQPVVSLTANRALEKDDLLALF